jgi:hypothetical protein
MQQVGRSLHDTLVHYGDGRMLVFLRDTPRSGATTVQERMQKALAPYGEQCPFHLSTICCPEDVQNPDALITDVENQMEELANG